MIRELLDNSSSTALDGSSEDRRMVMQLRDGEHRWTYLESEQAPSSTDIRNSAVVRSLANRYDRIGEP